MKKLLTAILPQFLLNILKKKYQQVQYNKWEQEGRPAPPPHLVKQRAIKEYQEKFGIGTLVETGTYRGDMVEAQKKNFRKIISIELGPELAAKARQRFSKTPNVKIVTGDSGDKLPGILNELDEPAIFWLDGHYSAGVTAKGNTECPIFQELDAIFADKKLDHVLLIDDARCFNGTGDYPAIDTLANYVKSKNPDYRVEVRDDIIRCTL